MSLLWNVLFYSLVTVAETSPRYTRVLIFHISVCSCPLIWEGARGEGVLGHHPLNHPLLSFSAQEWRIPPSSLSQHGGCAPNPLFPYTFSFSAFLTPSTLRRVSHFRQRKMAAITHTVCSCYSCQTHFSREKNNKKVCSQIKVWRTAASNWFFFTFFRSNQIRSKDYSRRVVTSTHTRVPRLDEYRSTPLDWQIGGDAVQLSPKLRTYLKLHFQQNDDEF
jgi:hypothetical protein